MSLATSVTLDLLVPSKLPFPLMEEKKKKKRYQYLLPRIVVIVKCSCIKIASPEHGVFPRPLISLFSKVLFKHSFSFSLPKHLVVFRRQYECLLN